jgi:hypothetical protein
VLIAEDNSLLAGCDPCLFDLTGATGRQNKQKDRQTEVKTKHKKRRRN